MITLYHGSNVAISKVDLSKGLKDKDFGQGFYLADILSQAESMAQRRVRIVGAGIPAVTSFSFDESILCCGDLNVKIFPDQPNVEWARFVDANRHASETGFSHDFDIVVGPVADGLYYQSAGYNYALLRNEIVTGKVF